MLRRRITAALTIVLFTAISAEAILHLLAALSPEVDAVVSAVPIQPVVADDLLGWRGNPGYRGHDQAGFRNKSVLTKAAVIALGDSQTYGLRVTREQAWPQQLGSIENQSIYNMAFPGWGPPQSLLLFNQAVAMNPKLIVEGLYSGNDLVDSYVAVYADGRLPELRTTDPDVGRALTEAEQADPWADNESIQHVLPQGNWAVQTSFGDLIARNSKLFGLGHTIDVALMNSLVSDASANRSDGEDERPAFVQGRLRTVFEPRWRLVALDREDPRVREGLRVALESLARMDQRARAAEIRFAVLMIPTKELAFKDAVLRSGSAVDEAYSRLVEDEEATWQLARADLAGRQIELIDALPALRALIADGRNPYEENNNGHPNALGQRAIAEAVAAQVDRRGLLRR